MHRSITSATPHTHEIQDSAGEWLWVGDESSMAVIFNNISGINFEGRRQAWLQYMAWMSWFHRSAWPGRESPFRDGAQIKLAPIGGQPIAEFTFPASFSADLNRVTHEQQA